MPSTEASGAICVQGLDDSRNSAIHIKYRISLRSSSLREPRYPLLRVVWVCGSPSLRTASSSFSFDRVFGLCWGFVQRARRPEGRPPLERGRVPHRKTLSQSQPTAEVGQWLGQERAPGSAHVGACTEGTRRLGWRVDGIIDSMIPPQVHLRRPCYDFSFL